MPDFPPKRRKKVDYEALHSPLKRIPNLDTATVRDLLDLGIRHVHELNGRSPEALFEDIRKIRNAPELPPADRLPALRMAVYYAENDPPDASLLHPWKWSGT